MTSDPGGVPLSSGGDPGLFYASVKSEDHLAEAASALRSAGGVARLTREHRASRAASSGVKLRQPLFGDAHFHLFKQLGAETEKHSRARQIRLI